MESNCNNRNSMSCARGHVRGHVNQNAGCNQWMTNCDCMEQQRRREECKEHSQRGECKEQNRRRECKQCNKEEEMRWHKNQNEGRMQPCNEGVRMEPRARVERVVNQGDMKNCNRNVEVECVCQVKCKKDCHRHDEMEHLSCEFPVVMAYVPWQQWGEMYEAECGLMQGTIFKDLNFIFCGERC